MSKSSSRWRCRYRWLRLVDIEGAKGDERGERSRVRRVEALREGDVGPVIRDADQLDAVYEASDCDGRPRQCPRARFGTAPAAAQAVSTSSTGPRSASPGGRPRNPGTAAPQLGPKRCGSGRRRRRWSGGHRRAGPRFDTGTGPCGPPPTKARGIERPPVVASLRTSLKDPGRDRPDAGPGLGPHPKNSG